MLLRGLGIVLVGWSIAVIFLLRSLLFACLHPPITAMEGFDGAGVAVLDTLPVSCLPIVPEGMLFLRPSWIFWCPRFCPSSRRSGLLSMDSCMLSLEPGAVEIELYHVLLPVHGLDSPI